MDEIVTCTLAYHAWHYHPATKSENLLRKHSVYHAQSMDSLQEISRCSHNIRQPLLCHYLLRIHTARWFSWKTVDTSVYVQIRGFQFIITIYMPRKVRPCSTVNTSSQTTTAPCLHTSRV